MGARADGGLVQEASFNATVPPRCCSHCSTADGLCTCEQGWVRQASTIQHATALAHLLAPCRSSPGSSTMGSKRCTSCGSCSVLRFTNTFSYTVGRYPAACSASMMSNSLPAEATRRSWRTGGGVGARHSQLEPAARCFDSEGSSHAMPPPVTCSPAATQTNSPCAHAPAA